MRKLCDGKEYSIVYIYTSTKIKPANRSYIQGALQIIVLHYLETRYSIIVLQFSTKA